MHPHKCSFSFFLILSLLVLFSPLLLAPAAAVKTLSSQKSSSPSSPSFAACKSSLYPKLCSSILTAFQSSSLAHNPYGYGKFSVDQCLTRARKLSELIHRFLNQRQDSGHRSDAGALQDCRLLFELNVDYLESIVDELRLTDNQPVTGEVDDWIRSRLSAIGTNHETCYDGLVDAKSEILRPRGNETATELSSPAMFGVRRLYSVSLGLVTHALAENLKHHHKRQNVAGGSGDRLHPAAANVHRLPLSQFIKGLQRKSTNDTSVTKFHPRDGRILAEMEDNEIMIRDVVVVSKDDTGDFTTIGEAIEVSPNNTRAEDGYFVIYAKKGLYKEYITIPSYKTNIVLLGDGINATIITGDHNYADGWTTFFSATCGVVGDRFIAIDVTFRNTAGPEKGQAVALRNQADSSVFFRCSFEGYQDTLYIHSHRQFYRECDVYGTIDFIFGDAAAVFQDCNLLARKPQPHHGVVITASGREDPNHNTGISIHNCTIDAAPDLAANPKNIPSYLGRPWKLYARTVYMQSYIGGFIDPAGWMEMNGTAGLDTLYYGEFENYGPGSDTSRRVHWPGYNVMSALDASKFTVSNFTMGLSWLPKTDIPFSGGLL